MEGTVSIQPASKSVFLSPAAHGWNLVRSVDANGTWDVRALANLDEAALLLNADQEFVLALPMSLVLTQRLSLPTVDAQDFAEMVRIQVEKTLPYAPEEITSDFEIITQTEKESLISAVAVHNEKLSEIAAPLISRGHIPAQVTVYAAQRAATHAADGCALLIFPEGDSVVGAISENGKISFTRTLDGANPETLRMELPQMALSAELQGISSNFSRILLDESCLPMREVVETLLAHRPDLVGLETPPAAIKLNLLPAAWREQKLQLKRRAGLRKKLIAGVCVYAAALLVFLAYCLILRLQVSRLDKSIAKDAPKVDFVKTTEANWKALAPAIDPRYYPIEVLLHLFENLPNQDVRITTYSQSSRQILVDGEAPSTTLAYQFVEKVKKNPGLQAFQFDFTKPPTILGNAHAQFRMEAKLK